MCVFCFSACVCVFSWPSFLGTQLCPPPPFFSCMRCLSRLAFLCLLLADGVLHLAVRVTARQVSVCSQPTMSTCKTARGCSRCSKSDIKQAKASSIVASRWPPRRWGAPSQSARGQSPPPCYLDFMEGPRPLPGGSGRWDPLIFSKWFPIKILSKIDPESCDHTTPPMSTRLQEDD